MRLVLGTRGSALAVTQSNTVAELLREAGHVVELVTISTTGDRARGSLRAVAGLGVFAAELRAALLAGECDLAVHSLKDLPVQSVPGLHVAAVPRRADHRDALCARDALTLAGLPAGSRVGTGSPRRVAQLRRLRPDLDYVDIRGNVDTRLARVAQGDLDAVVLAAAGLFRLGISDRATELLPILPAPGQGALAVECRSDDAAVTAALAELDDAATRASVTAERAVLARLGGGCAAPIGAFATADELGVELDAGAFAVDGSAAREVRVAAPDALAAGEAAAEKLLAEGAADVCDLSATRPSRLAELHADAAPRTAGLWPAGRPSPTVFVPRDRDEFAVALEARGMRVLSGPVQRQVSLDFEAPEGADWVVLTSARAVGALVSGGWEGPGGAMVAAVGPATARAVEAAGWHVDLVPDGAASGEALADAFPAGTGRVLLPCSDLASTTVEDGLRQKGWTVLRVPVYTMATVASLPDAITQAWAAGEVDAVLVTSGSTARAIDELLRWRDDVRVLAIGIPTAETLGRLGVVAAASPGTEPDVVADAMRDMLQEGQA